MKLLVDPATVELEEKMKTERERVWKLKRYYQYFRVKYRYEISFRDFLRKVNNGTWEAYLAE